MNHRAKGRNYEPQRSNDCHDSNFTHAQTLNGLNNYTLYTSTRLYAIENT